MTRRLILPVIAAVAFTAVVVIYWRHGYQGDAGIQHWIAVHTGTDNEQSPYYGFFSGFGSDLSEAALITAGWSVVLGMLHKTNCHQRHCWRIGKHQVDGSPWCNRHHETARQQLADRTGPDPLTAIGIKLDRLANSNYELAQAIRLSLNPQPTTEGNPQ